MMESDKDGDFSDAENANSDDDVDDDYNIDKVLEDRANSNTKRRGETGKGEHETQQKPPTVRTPTPTLAKNEQLTKWIGQNWKMHQYQLALIRHRDDSHDKNNDVFFSDGATLPRGLMERALYHYLSAVQPAPEQHQHDVETFFKGVPALLMDATTTTSILKGLPPVLWCYIFRFLKPVADLFYHCRLVSRGWMDAVSRHESCEMLDVKNLVSLKTLATHLPKWFNGNDGNGGGGGGGFVNLALVDLSRRRTIDVCRFLDCFDKTTSLSLRRLCLSSPYSKRISAILYHPSMNHEYLQELKLGINDVFDVSNMNKFKAIRRVSIRTLCFVGTREVPWLVPSTTADISLERDIGDTLMPRHKKSMMATVDLRHAAALENLLIPFGGVDVTHIGFGETGSTADCDCGYSLPSSSPVKLISSSLPALSSPLPASSLSSCSASLRRFHNFVLGASTSIISNNDHVSNCENIKRIAPSVLACGAHVPVTATSRLRVFVLRNDGAGCHEQIRVKTQNGEEEKEREEKEEEKEGKEGTDNKKNYQPLFLTKHFAKEIDYPLLEILELSGLRQSSTILRTIYTVALPSLQWLRIPPLSATDRATFATSLLSEAELEEVKKHPGISFRQIRRTIDTDTHPVVFPVANYIPQLERHFRHTSDVTKVASSGPCCCLGYSNAMDHLLAGKMTSELRPFSRGISVATTDDAALACLVTSTNDEVHSCLRAFLVCNVIIEFVCR